MYYLSSAFSLSMSPSRAIITLDPLDRQTFVSYLTPMLEEGLCRSIVGHASSAEILSLMFGMEIPVNREEIKLSYGDSIYVMQIMNGLQEGQVLSLDDLRSIPIEFRVATIMRPRGVRVPLPLTKLADDEAEEAEEAKLQEGGFYLL